MYILPVYRPILVLLKGIILDWLVPLRSAHDFQEAKQHDIGGAEWHQKHLMLIVVLGVYATSKVGGYAM